MIKKILKYTLIIIVITLIVLLVYVYWVTKKQEQQRKQYPYSEIQIKNNLYFYKNELLTGKSYVLGENSDSTSLEFLNGRPDGKNTYINGKKNGLSETYLNGILRFKTIYKDDVKDGIEDYFREDGTLNIRTTFKNGKEDGIQEFYGEDGKLRSTIRFKDGVDLDELVRQKNTSSNSQSSGGVYTYESGYRRMKITITPEKWFGWLEDGSGDGNYSGKTIINGKMNGSDLYDENGIEKRGYVSGSTIYYNDPLGEIRLSK